MRKNAIIVAIAVAVLAAVATVATASEHAERGEHERRAERHGSRGPEAPDGAASSAPRDPEGLALYRKECGACHIAYPPAFLPADAHQRIMAGLERHFGQNAELDPAVRDRIERYLVNVAGAERGAGDLRRPAAVTAPDRITETPWFQRKHRRLDARVTARPSVRSLANCAACHAGAANWDFEDDRVRIPAS